MLPMATTMWSDDNIARNVRFITWILIRRAYSMCSLLSSPSYLNYNAFSSQSFRRYTLHSKPSQKIQCILFLRKIMRFFLHAYQTMSLHIVTWKSLRLLQCRFVFLWLVSTNRSSKHSKRETNANNIKLHQRLSEQKCAIYLMIFTEKWNEWIKSIQTFPSI